MSMPVVAQSPAMAKLIRVLGLPENCISFTISADYDGVLEFNVRYYPSEQSLNLPDDEDKS